MAAMTPNIRSTFKEEGKNKFPEPSQLPCTQPCRLLLRSPSPEMHEVALNLQHGRKTVEKGLCLRFMPWIWTPVLVGILPQSFSEAELGIN
jgi:hypothetical protein